MILKVKRVKINKNLQTIYQYKTDLRIDLDSDYPIRWETFQFNDKEFTKVYLASGDTFLTEMPIDDWEVFYLSKKELYEKSIAVKQAQEGELPPIIPN